MFMQLMWSGRVCGADTFVERTRLWSAHVCGADTFVERTRMDSQKAIGESGHVPHKLEKYIRLTKANIYSR